MEDIFKKILQDMYNSASIHEFDTFYSIWRDKMINQYKDCPRCSSGLKTTVLIGFVNKCKNCNYEY